MIIARSRTRKDPVTMSHPPRLTDDDRRIIARARELAALRGADAFCEHTGKTALDMAHAVALGQAQVTLGWLADIAERLGGDGG
jgi:hypothetical protein